MALPRIVVLKSNYNQKYLRYLHEDVELHGFLQFSGEEIISPYTKFEVEMAKCGGGLVHIRCCYNNKYLVRWSPKHWWIFAAADEPEERRSKWSCTLFEFACVDGDATTTRFRHVQLKHYACLWRAHLPFENCLFAGSASLDQDRCDVYTIIDWESLLILPKHVTFKAVNDRYLTAVWIEGHPCLQFVSSDIRDPNVSNEVFTTRDGSIRIKSNRFSKFWRHISPNLIWADSDDTTTANPDTLFCPVKVDNNVIALRNLGSNFFCTVDGSTSYLNATSPTIPREAHLEVHETVITRDIYNINYRLMDSRIYKKDVVTMATGDAINRTLSITTVDVMLSHSKTVSATWDTTVSYKLGVKTTLETGVPLIVDGKVEISDEYSKAHKWGETETLTNVVETTYKATVPPMSRVRVSLLATKGSCDVPFSYTWRDTLADGKQITFNMDDGLYTGTNSFDFKYKTKEEKL